MTATGFVWLLVPAPSLPLALNFFAFRRILQSKKFEMRMLLQLGETGRGQVWGSIDDTPRMRKTPLFSVELHV
jgi:hypothetical protein